MQAGNRKWQVFLIVSIGVFLSTLDSSMINIALPEIMAEFNSSLVQTEWVVLAYLLTITTSLLFFGHLADRIGRGRIYSFGLFFFSAGSLACAFSQSFLWLIMARFFQASGAAMMMSTGPALIKQVFPPHQLGRGQGLIGIAVSLGLMSGPTLGGYIIHYWSWRSLFFMTVPVSLICGLAAGIILPSTRRGKVLNDFDMKGVFLWAFILLVASLVLTYGVAGDFSFSVLLAGLVLLPIVLFYFIQHELKAIQPILPIQLFKKKYFSVGVTCAVISFLVLFAALILIPFYLSHILELDSSRIGMVMIALPLAALLVAPMAGWLSDFLGARILSTLGLALLAAGMLLLSGLRIDSSPLDVAVRMSFLGMGQALFLSPNSSSVLGRTTKKQSSTASALLATARNLGMMLGIGLSGLSFSLFFGRLTGGLDMRDYAVVHATQFVGALHYSFQAAAVIACLGVIVSWQRPSFRKRRVGERAEG
ncbi:MAG: MFS transporter [Thermodesulfobacteriota bacterium]|nr:MFS transporter [Thermodesulfobacteriota bacterium]